MFDDDFDDEEMPLDFFPLDVYEYENKIYVDIAIYNISLDSIELEFFNNNQLMIGGKILMHKDSKRRYHVDDIPVGDFEVCAQLPCKITLDKADLEYDRGLLTIALNKKDSIEDAIKGYIKTNLKNITKIRKRQIARKGTK